MPPRSAALDDGASRVGRIVKEHHAAALRTFLGERPDHQDSLPENSLAELRAWHAREDAWLAELQKVDDARLWGRPEWVAYGTLRNTLESSIAARICRAELWPAHQFGWQTTLLALLDQQPLGTPVARADALSRWRQLPRFVDNEVSNLREGMRLGYTAPRRNIELALAQLDALLAAPLAESIFASPVRRDTDAQFKATWLELAQTELVPATTRYRDFLRDEYLSKARTTIAIAALPNGAECYRARIRLHTTAHVEPRDMYELGQKQVAEREAKALELARAVLGPSIVDLRAAKAAVDADPRNRFDTTDQALQFIEQAMARAQRAAPRWFARLPRSPLTLVPYDDFEAQAYPSARYETPAVDGSRPARFRIDTTHVSALHRLEIEHTAFHEGIPGHHLQLGRVTESPSDLQILDLAGGLSAYHEGWARYAESLADEMDLYSSDLDRFGAVSHLPTGLVTDPGIHFMGWSRQDALAWVATKQVGFSPATIETYVDRIAVCPGEMLSYGFGEREFVTLRREAEAALGAKFDIKSFHEAVLTHGAVPLPLLREIVRRWIRETQHTP